MDMETLMPIIISYGIRILGVIILFMIGSRVAKWAGRTVSKSMDKRGIDKTLGNFAGSMVRYLVLILILLACLSIFGIETTSFAAVIGAASLAIGLAFQGSLSNLAAGAMLIIFRPYKVGDLIAVAGQTGVVANLSLFTTDMDTVDNRRVIVPNGAIFGSTIENMTHHDARRVDINVGADYGADIDATRKALEECVKDLPINQPNPAQIFLVDLGDSSVNWQVRVWCGTGDYWGQHEAVTRAVKNALDPANIGIPYPTMDVNLSQAG